uniref:Ig-like domain-containing protein n=1 Tax=Scophthalmus maximus TaxID=52904 RepID=A0A8D3DJH0_SCOMX
MSVCSSVLNLPSVTHGGRISIEQKGQEAKLEIKEVTKSDSGQYRCVASNKHGEIECSADMHVDEKKEATLLEGDLRAKLKKVKAVNAAGPSRPSATVGPMVIKDQTYQVLTMRAGENVKLSCSITGRPVPQVTWYKDGKEIDKRTIMDIDITISIGTSSLAINEAGEIETSGKLRLQAAPQFHPGFPLKEKYSAGAGTSLRLHVIYIGRPIPKIMWFYGKKPLNASENVIIENTESYTHLVVRNVQRKTNAGCYKVQLSNGFGTIDTVLRVEIQGKTRLPRARSSPKYSHFKFQKNTAFL